MTISPELHSAALIAVRDCMGTRPGERVLVVTDAPLRTIGYAVFEAARGLGNLAPDPRRGPLFVNTTSAGPRSTPPGGRHRRARGRCGVLQQ